MKSISPVLKGFLCAGALCLISASVTITRAESQDFPYRNPSLSPDERAKDLLGRLTLDEKAVLMQNQSKSIDRLGIPFYDWWSEALHGVGRAGLATVFPQAIGMAASFDDAAVLKAFDAISDEARAKHHDFKSRNELGNCRGLTFWTPNVNIFRDPRWGRGQETYGEDPYLSGRMGVAVVKGLQGDESAKYNKLHACAKHYAVHSGPEWNRHSFNAENIDWRDLWETYLPAFKDLVQEGHVKEVMCAYSRYEGEPCCGSKKLLQQILRDEWGFDGLVVSDCGAITDFFVKGRHETHPTKEAASADAVISGTDLECGNEYVSLPDAVRAGLIKEEQIDKSVFRILKARFELGLMDPDSLVSWSSIPLSVVDCKEHKALALDMARKSMTLLKNENNILPLSKNIRKIAVVGPNAADSVVMWGNYNGFPSHTVTILEGIKSKLPEGVVIYDKGCDWVNDHYFDSAFDWCILAGKTGFKGTYWSSKDFTGDVIATQVVSTPFHFHTGGATVYAPGVPLQNFSAKYNSVFKPEKSGEYILTITGDDGYRIFVNNEKVIDNWGDHGAETREYKLDAKAGKEYVIDIDYMQGGGEGELKFDIGQYRKVDPRSVLSRLGDADVVIFAGGISPRLEGEEMPVNYPGFKGGDRTGIELPQIQRDVMQVIKESGKKVIFVNCSGSAIALEPESKTADAILQSWYGGQAGGAAVADVLFGDYNPAGRLPVTFYRNISQLPDYEDYSMKGRTYRYMTQAPLYPFGYGLSYTTFIYGKAGASKTIKAGESLKLTVPLTNTGKKDGDEVMQVYVRDMNDKNGPLKSLRAFKRVFLKSGEKQNVPVELPRTAFEFYDTATNTMRVKPGKYELMYGGSSMDRDLQKLVVTIR